ncbi:MAG: ATP-binding protein, partial [Pseudomonadota bacterium]
MFNALLRIAEIEAEKQKQTFAEIRLDKVLLDAIDLYQPLADAKDIAINTSLTDCSVIGDRDLLFQAMSNLLDNAIKFSPEKSHIDISVSIKGDVAVVEIADYGSGIPDPLKQEATKRFFRIDESRSAPGHGLGLAMVAAIVKRHEGSLSLHDTRDHAVFPG